MNIHHSILYSLLLAIGLLCACQTNTAYYSYQELPNNRWSQKDTLQYVLPDSLSAPTYQLEIGIRHTGAYSYRDLWMELIQYVPKKDSQTDEWMAQKDTLHIYLADEKGNWFGKGTTSSFYQLVVPCGTFSLPNTTSTREEENSQQGTDNEQQASSSSKGNPQEKRVKYTFLGTEKTIGIESKHILKITHIMSDSILLNISDVGVKLTPVQP